MFHWWNITPFHCFIYWLRHLFHWHFRGTFRYIFTLWNIYHHYHYDATFTQHHFAELREHHWRYCMKWNITHHYWHHETLRCKHYFDIFVKWKHFHEESRLCRWKTFSSFRATMCHVLMLMMYVTFFWWHFIRKPITDYFHYYWWKYFADITPITPEIRGEIFFRPTLRLFFSHFIDEPLKSHWGHEMMVMPFRERHYFADIFIVMITPSDYADIALMMMDDISDIDAIFAGTMMINMAMMKCRHMSWLRWETLLPLTHTSLFIYADEPTRLRHWCHHEYFKHVTLAAAVHSALLFFKRQRHETLRHYAIITYYYAWRRNMRHMKAHYAIYDITWKTLRHYDITPHYYATVKYEIRRETWFSFRWELLREISFLRCRDFISSISTLLVPIFIISRKEMHGIFLIR